MNSFVRHSRILVLLCALSACAPVIMTHGQPHDPGVLAEIEPGKTSRRKVERFLGTPSTQGVFSENVWYYMSARTERNAFFEPKLIERQIVAIIFDDKGIVEDIVTYTENDKKDIELVSRITRTAGNELTLLQQLFGNVGRFETSQ